METIKRVPEVKVDLHEQKINFGDVELGVKSMGDNYVFFGRDGYIDIPDDSRNTFNKTKQGREWLVQEGRDKF